MTKSKDNRCWVMSYPNFLANESEPCCSSTAISYLEKIIKLINVVIKKDIIKSTSGTVSEKPLRDKAGKRTPPQYTSAMTNSFTNPSQRLISRYKSTIAARITPACRILARIKNNNDMSIRTTILKKTISAL